MVDNEKINFFREFFSFKTNKAEGVIGFHRALGIGSWDMFNGGTGGLIGSWLLYFLTSFGGVNPGLAALLISARLVIDMFWAPAVAVISDNFYRFALGRKYGRRRFFLIFANGLGYFFGVSAIFFIKITRWTTSVPGIW